MKLTPAELAYVSSKGLYITEKCDRDGRLLNQSVRYTIAEKPEVYCSAECRDFAFFGDRREAKKRATPGQCIVCGATLEGRRRGSFYCGEGCKKHDSRHAQPYLTAEVKISGTPTQQNQQLAEVKIGG